MKSYKPSQLYEIAKNGVKMGGFVHVFAYKSPKMLFFALKYLTRYTHEKFFEEYINFKIFRNLSHCGVIPVRSFGSHIRPQPHGLGLKRRSHQKLVFILGCVQFNQYFLQDHLLLSKFFRCQVHGYLRCV